MGTLAATNEIFRKRSHAEPWDCLALAIRALATKAAIQFARDRFATPKHFLHGGSAGSIGTYSAGWALQQQGLAPDFAYGFHLID
jgi:hypothetical protein